MSGVDSVVAAEVVVEEFSEFVSVPIDDCIGDCTLPPMCRVPRCGSALDDRLGKGWSVDVFVPEFFVNQGFDGLIALVEVLGCEWFEDLREFE